jgi:hypothetical protein
LIPYQVYAIDIFASDIFDTIHITDITMKVEYSDNHSTPDVIEEYSVVWETVKNMSYISFDYTGNFLRQKNVAHGRKKYLVLYGRYLVFYNNKNQMEYYLSGVKYTGHLASFATTKISASSELKESGVIYKASNLFNVNELMPWAEGVPGDGIGQTIQIEFERGLVGGLNGLYISNGYVDYNRPYLYEYNNRIKKIRVRYLGYDDYQDFEVDDTPHFQYINIGIEYNPGIVIIEIIEVYKGSKWADTCINTILPFGF